MKRRASRLVSILLILSMALAALPGAALAADGPEQSVNRNGQDYLISDNPVKSHLYANEDGGLTRVEYTGGKIVVEDYDSAFRFLSGREIPIELDIWGGFFAGETYNFFVFGQMNEEESNEKEVIRIVKYSKDWRRLGQASLFGANTAEPFHASSLRFSEYDGELYIRTGHLMFALKAYGNVNHQANMTIAIRESDMEITDTYYRVKDNSIGYVSHSFNQFVIVDRQQRIVTVDHGDAHPRGAVLMVYDKKAGEGKFSGRVTSVEIQSFPGTSGNNLTGASVGGLAETSGGYAVSYNFDGLGRAGARSVYFAYVDKDSLKVETKKIFDAGTETSTSTPILVPTGLGGGYILWNAKEVYLRSEYNGYIVYNATDTLYYAAYSDGGVGEIKTATAPLSSCQPIVYNGKVVWYTTNHTAPTFYLLDESGVTAVETGATTETGTSTETATPADVSVTVNGRDVAWTDAVPFIDENGRVLVPLSALSAYLYFGYGWDDASRVASFSNWGGSKVICFTVGDSIARTSGGGEIRMDTAAVIRNDRTYAPVRYLAEYFGYTVDWDAVTRTVIITG